jgi:CheY-like chemotaxis protein
MSKKIFIIEDDKSIRENLQELLETAGYSVETASNGREALNKLSVSSQLPSLIILDLMMPIMDGYQFRKEQEIDPKLSLIPVVITTAGGNIESKVFRLGAKAYFKKPFDIDDVLNTVKRFST